MFIYWNSPLWNTVDYSYLIWVASVALAHTVFIQIVAAATINFSLAGHMLTDLYGSREGQFRLIPQPSTRIPHRAGCRMRSSASRILHPTSRKVNYYIILCECPTITYCSWRRTHVVMLANFHYNSINNMTLSVYISTKHTIIEPPRQDINS